MYITQDMQESIFFFILGQLNRTWHNESLIATFYENNFDAFCDEEQIPVLIQNGKLAGWIDSVDDMRWRLTDLGKRKGQLISKEELRALGELVVKLWKI